MEPITHCPSHGTLEHCAGGVGTGQPLRQVWKAAIQVWALLPIVSAHCSRQLISPAPPVALQPWTHVVPAVKAFAKHCFAVPLQPPIQGAVVPAGMPGQVVVHALREVWQPLRAVCIAVMHAAWHCRSPAAQLCKQAPAAVRVCIMQTLRPRAQLLLHCCAPAGL